jgi:hypothetical protein
VVGATAGSREAAPRPVFDPRLPYDVPALTQQSQVRFGVSALFMSPSEQLELARHEHVHSIHQQLSRSHGQSAHRANAESVAERWSRADGPVPLNALLLPAPARLCFPRQQKAPWDGVWIGNAGIIGEVGGKTAAVRILLSYEDLSIDKLPEYQTYHCHRDRSKGTLKMVATMRKVASEIDKVNALIPASSESSIALVAITKTETSGFRIANGKGLIVIETKENWVATAAHEGGHAVLDHHLRFGGAGGKGAGTLPLRIADLFLRLGQTTSVPVPDKKFNPKSPPSLKGGGQPAGLVMVNDSVWSGAGGHSWENADEFFASAFAAFRKEPRLLKAIVRHYAKADAAIEGLAKELFGVLQVVATDPALSKLSLLAAASRPAAEKELQQILPAPDFSKKGGAIGSLIDPSTLPAPDKIRCP